MFQKIDIISGLQRETELQFLTSTKTKIKRIGVFKSSYNYYCAHSFIDIKCILSYIDA